MPTGQVGRARVTPHRGPGLSVVPTHSSAPDSHGPAISLSWQRMNTVSLHLAIVMSQIMLPPNLYVEVIISRTSECDCVWGQGH